MNTLSGATWIAFADQKCVAMGVPREVVTRVRAFVDSRPEVPVLILDAWSSEPVEVDLRGRLATILSRLPVPTVEAPTSTAAAAEVQQRGPGRPRLGVVAREVTLLPRHWDWLGAQPGGASVALRKLVEKSQRASAEADSRRMATESAYRFMHALAGNEKGFEEASRALFAGQFDRLNHEVLSWPPDVRAHLLELAGRAMDARPAEGGLPAAD
jgi:hypothetical protein